MILNNKSQMFSIWFPIDFFYGEVIEQWTPFVEKMKLPYMSLTDFMNSQIQKVNFPSIDIGESNQQQGQFDIGYTVGKEMEPLLNKTLTITMKLTESYLTYWIFYSQIHYFLEYKNKYGENRVFMNNVHLSFLNDAGFSLVDCTYKYLVPTSLGTFDLSYAAQLASYTTFDISFRYNRFDITPYK